MITIAIVAILAALAMPSYRQTIQSNRTVTDANEFVTAFNLARGEAMTRSRPVTLCPSANGTSCVGAASWAVNRWIVFTDYGVRGQVNPATDTVLRVWDPINKDNTLEAVESAKAVQWISFDRSGMATTDNSVVNTGTATLPPQTVFKLRPRTCASSTTKLQRTITLELRGRASVTNDPCS